MIKYQLHCANRHEFEGWFQNSAAYDVQEAARLISCPSCGSVDVKKAIMSPRVKSGTRRDVMINDEARRQIAAIVERVTAEVVAKAEYVGPRFAAEARKIHMEEAAERAIYGEASVEEANELVEDGIPFSVLPPLAKDQN